MSEQNGCLLVVLEFVLHGSTLILPIKKSLHHPKACPEKRQLFQNKIADYKNLCRSIIYIDEEAFAHDMPRLYRCFVKGKCCFAVHGWGAI